MNNGKSRILQLVLCGIFVFRVSVAASEITDQISMGVSLHNEGVAFQGQRMYEEAISKYDQAISIWEDLIDKAETSGLRVVEEKVALGIIKATFNKANIYYRIGNLQKAEKCFKLCIEKQVSLEEAFGYQNHLRRGRAHRELAKIYIRNNGFDIAYAQLVLAQQYLDLAVSPYSQDMGTLENAFSLLFLKWREPDSLLIHSSRKYQIYKRLGNDYFMASAQVSQAVGQEMLNKLDAALVKIDSALQYYLQTPKRHQLTIAKSYNNKAHILAKKRSFEKAIELENKVLSLLNDMPKDFDVLQEKLNALNSLAHFQFLDSKFRQSLISCDSALAVNAWEVSELNYEKEAYIGNTPVYNKIGLLHSLGQIARANLGLQNYSKAQSVFTLAINYLNKIRREYNDTESKLKLTEIAKVIFEGAIALHLDPAVNEPEKAFAYAEQSKAFTLLEGIKHSKAMRIAKVPEELLQREYELRGDIARLERKYLAAEEPEEKTEHLQAIRQHKEELTGLLNRLQRNKEYRKLMSFEAPSSRQLQRKALGVGQTLVEYFVGEEKTYVFVLPKKGKLKVLQLDLDSKGLNQQVDEFWSSIYHYGCDEEVLRQEAPELLAMGEEARKERLQAKYLALGQSLYTQLFQPIVDLGVGTRFVIVPDEGLSYLPFDALLVGAPEIDNFSFYPYLGREFTLSYAYSGNLLLEVQQGRGSKARKILAMAPSFSSRQLAMNKSALSRLTNNVTEINAICDIFSDQCDPLEGMAANLESFRNLVEQNAYRIIHLSTHGKANDKNPNQSWISFTQNREQLDESQLLYASDLYALPIRADLVVLSACETNKGRLRRGEGIMSFARGFSAAGVKSVLSTFWVIGEDPSLLVMKDFYEQLNDGAAKDEALQKARLGLMENSDFSHPFYWSAFVPIGQMSEVEAGGSGRWLVGALLLLLAFLIFRLPKSSRLRKSEY